MRQVKRLSPASPPIEIRAGGLRPLVDRRRQVFALEKPPKIRGEGRPRRGTGGAGKLTFRISSPACLGAGEEAEEAKEGACASRTEFIRRVLKGNNYTAPPF